MTNIEITKEILTRLLDKYGTNTAVAQELNVGETTIRRLRQKFGIEGKNPGDSKILDALRRELGEGTPIKVTTEKKANGEALCIQLTDWHVGSIVRDEKGKIIYDRFIARQRAEILCSKVLMLLKDHLVQGTKITEIHLLLTGDMVDGEMVFPGQPWRTEMAPPKQVITVVDILRNFILSLLEFKMPIYIHAVKGNHGIPKIKGLNPESNWDLMVYLILMDWIANNSSKSVLMEYSEGDYQKCDIMGWTYLLRHEGPSQAETASGSSKAGGWNKVHTCDAMIYGHFHHPALMEWNGMRLFMGPSLKGPDEFSESIAKGSEPAQCVWGVTKKHVSTFYYIVDLR